MLRPSFAARCFALSLLALGCAGPDPAPLETGQQSRPVTLSVPNVTVLVALYTGGMTTEQVAAARAGLESGREFFWRNSKLRFNVQLDVRELAGRPPDVFIDFSAVELDLRTRAIDIDQYRVVIAFDGTPDDGRGLDGNFNGFVLQNGGVASYALHSGRSYGREQIELRFIQALQALLDTHLAEAISGLPEMIGGLPYLTDFDRNQTLFPDGIDHGALWDWQAGTLRLFNGYANLQAPWVTQISVNDTDGDGLPDSDARVAADEARLGTNPAVADSDGDGSSDGAEYFAGVLRGTNPVAVDSDGDGLRDGVDPLPLELARAQLGRTDVPIAINGIMVEGTWNLLARDLKGGHRMLLPSAPSELHGTWDDNFLYLGVKTFENPGSIEIQLDGSPANGPWLGMDFFYLRVDLAALRVQTRQTLGDRPFEFGPEQPGPEDLPFTEVAGASVARANNATGMSEIEIAIPKALAVGFGVEAIHRGEQPKTSIPLGLNLKVGLSVRLNAIGGAVDKFTGPTAGFWGSFFEPLAFVDLSYGEKVVIPDPEPEPLPKLVKVRSKTFRPDAVTNSVEGQFQLENIDAAPLDLARLELRYWYRAEQTRGQIIQVDWAGRMPSGNDITWKVQPRIVAKQNKVGGLHYVSYKFASNAGKLGKGEFAELHGRLNTWCWQDYDQLNDPSFNPSYDWVDWDKVTVYRDGKLIYGKEP
jgi:hypothetical protein